MAELYYSIKQKRLFDLFQDVPIWYRLSDEECAQMEQKESTIMIGDEEWQIKEKPIRNCIGFYSVERPDKVPFANVTEAIAPLLGCVGQIKDSFAVYDPQSLELYDVKGHKFLGGQDRDYALKNARSEKIITYPEYPEVTVKVMHWILPTLRLIGTDTKKIEELAAHIIAKWEGRGDTYTVTILAHCNEDGEYRLDLILCGEPKQTIRATSSVLFPKDFGMMGKMGFAILDKYQKNDYQRIAQMILEGKSCAEVPELAKYAEWQKSIETNYSVGSNNIQYIMNLEIRSAFAEKLMQMAYYSHTQMDFDKYLEFVNHVLDEADISY